MAEQDIFGRLKKLMVGLWKVDETKVVPEASSRYALDADSLDFIELIAAVQDTFGIEISDEDAERVGPVQDAVNYIELKR